MFGKIIEVNKSYAIIKLSVRVDKDLLNYHVVFEDDNKRILGEIDEINETTMKVVLLGEFTERGFLSGVIRRPSMAANTRLINNDELAIIADVKDPQGLELGKSPLYTNYPIKVNINEFFSNHSAIFGNTGSGKTFGVARIIQNVFRINNPIAYNSSFVIFNNYSEYDEAFKDISKYNANFHYKKYSSTADTIGEYRIQLPLWLLDIDDYANILDVYEYGQLSIIEKALTYVTLFASQSEDANKIKNHLIAKAIISIMYTNQTSSRIRDEIFNLLKDCNTEELNLNAVIPGVGYTRGFRECFNLNDKGEFIERNLIAEYVEKLVIKDYDYSENYVPCFFTLKDFEIALNFALISEGLLLNDETYSEAMALKVKLHKIRMSTYGSYFEANEFMDLDKFIEGVITVPQGKAQIINITLEDIDDRFAKTLVKVYSRLFFRYSKGMKERASRPIHLVLEEAHRYVQEDNDTEILGYNIFDRIAKEGRKYGLILDLITQRPTELNSTTISQCSNFLVFKINHPEDLDYIRKMVPNVSADIIEKQKTLQSGTCVAFGKMMQIPMIVKLDLPDPVPRSSNCDVYGRWMVNIK